MAFHDLTPDDVSLPPALKRLLGLNLNYCPTPRAITKDDILQQLPAFTRTLRLRTLFKGTNQWSTRTSRDSAIYVPNSAYNPPPSTPVIEYALTRIQAKVSVASWIPSRSRNLTNGQRVLVKTLQFRPDLQVVLTDKNLGPAVMTRTQYIDLCLDHLLDQDTYKQCVAPQQAIIRLLRTRIRQFYNTIAKQHATLPDWSNTKIIIAGLDDKGMNRFYGLAKIHKPQLCIRPIVSNTKSVMQGLSKWLHFMMQPYLQRTSTYLRDSDQLLQDLRSIQATDDMILITFDVVSMYTSINIDFALQVIRQELHNDPWIDAIMFGLRVVLTSNYFVFGDLIWLQLNGTAMGTSVAPTFASLFLAHFERTLICDHFTSNLVYFKRYIDDGFIIWKQDKNKPFEFKRLQALLRRSRLQFTFEFNPSQVAFLDLWIIRDNDKFMTRTHEKTLNLHLYLPAASAHPPGVLKGLIFGLIKKYKKQNTNSSDFATVCKLFYRRLRDRGYSNTILLPLFDTALHQASTSRTPLSQVFFKISYDPNGPSRARLRNLLDFSNLTRLCSTLHIDKLSICYTKPPSLKRKLCPTSLRLDCSPTPAARLYKRLRSASTSVGDKP